ncbi:MAG: exo-alpha-sialidase, partial [Planctomycetes bacterium]|nr:exo-alpha-sialidase [Planctomycetota bacterium]
MVGCRGPMCSGSSSPGGSRLEADMKSHTDLSQQDLFISGQNGYHTYRIPAIIATTQGTLLAFCEGRTSCSSDTGDIDIVSRRSFDGGLTWTPMQVVTDMGQDTIGNPCPVVDHATGTIWLPLCWNARLGPESQIVIGRAQRTVWLCKSTDDGASWTAPVEITQQVKRPEWRWYATGPGHGVQLADGRLVVPCDFSAGDPDPEHNHLGSHVIFSDDHGASWQIGGVIHGRVEECAVAPLGDGRLYLNMRARHGLNRRAVAWSTDDGMTWSPVTLDQALVEPICQAGVQALGGQRVLFSNPASTQRENLTVRLS